jgi:transposase
MSTKEAAERRRIMYFAIRDRGVSKRAAAEALEMASSTSDLYDRAWRRSKNQVGPPEPPGARPVRPPALYNLDF